MALSSISLVDYFVLPVRDISRSRRFYRDVTGVPIEYERADWVKFRIGATALALRPLDGQFAGRRVEGPAVQLAFRVSFDEVDDCHEELKAHGVEIFDPPVDQHWGHRTLYFAGPEGNLLEIYADFPTERG